MLVVSCPAEIKYLARIKVSELFRFQRAQWLFPNIGRTVAREHVVQRLSVRRPAESPYEARDLEFVDGGSSVRGNHRQLHNGRRVLLIGIRKVLPVGGNDDVPKECVRSLAASSTSVIRKVCLSGETPIPGAPDAGL